MKVNSSLLDEVFEWVKVDDKSQFDVRFPNGRYYRYYDVPFGIYSKMLSAQPSVGKFFDLYIKKAGYKFEEVSHLYIGETSQQQEALLLNQRLKKAAQRIQAMIQKAANERGIDKALYFADEYFSESMIVKAINDELFPR